MNRHASPQTDRGFNVHDRSGRGGSLPAGRQQRAEAVLGGHGWQALEHVGEGRLLGCGPAETGKKPEDFPSFSRPKPLSLRLENGLFKHSKRARAPQSHRKRPRMGFFFVV